MEATTIGCFILVALMLFASVKDHFRENRPKTSAAGKLKRA
jgi:hypothetical protein